MHIRIFTLLVAVSTLIGNASAQNYRSRPGAISLQAVVRPIVKIKPVASRIFVNNAAAEVLNIGDERIEISVWIRGDGESSTEVNVPIVVNSNVKNYLFRASSSNLPVPG